jgi:Protein of unknown function (DUF2505)
MHFTTEHHFPASPGRVAALIVDADFETGVALPDLSTPTVLLHDTNRVPNVLRVRYGYIGQLDPMARRLLGGRELALVQEVRVDPATGTGRLTLEAEADPSRLHGAAAIRITPSGARASVRRLDGDFTVRVPLMGSTVERRLLPGILSRLDVEAAALTERLRRDGEGDG